MLIYVCCDLLSINKYYTILDYKYFLLEKAFLTCVLLKTKTIYIFFPASGCVHRGPSALLCPGAYTAVKTALDEVNNASYNFRFCRMQLCTTVSVDIKFQKFSTC